MPSIVTLILQVSRQNGLLTQPLDPSHRNHILIIFQECCCFQRRATTKENICKKYYFKKADFNVFLLLGKKKFTNFRALKVQLLIEGNCFHVKKLVKFLYFSNKIIKFQTSFIMILINNLLPIKSLIIHAMGGYKMSLTSKKSHDNLRIQYQLYFVACTYTFPQVSSNFRQTEKNAWETFRRF